MIVFDHLCLEVWLLVRLGEWRLCLLVNIMHYLVNGGALCFAVILSPLLVLLPFLSRAQRMLECLVTGQITLLVVYDGLLRQDVHLRKHSLGFGILDFCFGGLACSHALIDAPV